MAANIAFGLGYLGLRPLLVGTVGADFAEYRDWLEQHGVDTSAVRESAHHHTARFVGTTDLDMNQIASFYPGAMTEDQDIDLSELPASSTWSWSAPATPTRWHCSPSSASPAGYRSPPIPRGS